MLACHSLMLFTISCITCLPVVFQVALYCMFSSQMAFYAKVSDPAIGGTYMTLLNTVSNLGEFVSSLTNCLTVKLVTHRCVCSFPVEGCY